MKKIQTIGLIVTLMMAFFGCDTVDEDPAGQRGVAVVPLVSEPNPGIFINGDVNSFIEFEVDFSTGTQTDKTEVVVSHGDNFERVKVQELTSFPATVSVTFGDVLTALGLAPTEIKDGDVIYVEVETTNDGIKSRSNAALGIAVVCEFDPVLAIGNYRAVSEDWAVDGAVTITADPVDQYTVYVAGLAALDGWEEDGGPLVMHINPATLKVTADKTVLHSLVWFGYTNYYYQGSGSFNSCNGTYTMDFTIGVDQGSWGVNGFVLTRM